MNYFVICVGNLKERYWKEAEAEYIKRLSAYGSARVLEVKEAPLAKNASEADIRAAIEKEGRALLAAAPERAFKIALDVKGKSLTSEAFAEKLQAVATGGTSALAFFIGGSYGLSAAVLAACDLRLSFSAFTFPHQMMRPVLLEQIYRACKINAGETYHK
jgi:23S rRNA (pseudouridine1915-N3)-methyltransferase